MLTATEVLEQDGSIARQIDGFTPRKQQQEMAEWIADVLDQGGTLVCEAGTGTGKTYAYLVPALMSGCRTIISTGTKTLQDQLFHRDLPTVRKALGLPVSIALLKGRSNYLCLLRLEQAHQEMGGQGYQLQSDLMRIRNWAGNTSSGDKAELSVIKEDSPAWALATSTTENCVGQDCHFFDDCFVNKARREAIKSDILVVNHHLFLADMALREEGFGEILPGADAVIFDEAHQLHDIASDFFGQTLSSRQIYDLCRDIEAAQLTEAADMAEISDVAVILEKSARDFRLAFGKWESRGEWPQALQNPKVATAVSELESSLLNMIKVLTEVAERGRALEACERRSKKLYALLSLFLANPSMETIEPDLDEVSEEELTVTNTLQAQEQVSWFESHKRGFLLHSTPLNIAQVFAERRKSYGCSWVYTSATLAVGDNFDHFLGRLGLDDAQTALWESPFDYQTQSLMYLPKLNCEPRDRGYTQAVIDAALPVIEACGGRTFLLFTSHRALREAADILQDEIEYPLLIQGDAPRNELLDQFRFLGNAVLLGAASFWEGVDVRGEALSCVIIDKLPFAAPDDPVMQARLNAIREQGMNPFMSYQVPEAAIALKQGSGRLIRDSSDKGILMLCDPRLRSKPYGKTFLKAIPPMPQTDDLTAVHDFMQLDIKATA